MDIFASPLPNTMLFFFSSPYLLLPILPILYWLRVVIVDIPVLFQVKREMLSDLSYKSKSLGVDLICTAFIIPRYHAWKCHFRGWHCGLMEVSFKGLALWPYCLQCQYSIWALICVLADASLIQRLANGLGRAVQDGPSVWAPATPMGNPKEAPSSWLWTGPSVDCWSL